MARRFKTSHFRPGRRRKSIWLTLAVLAAAYLLEPYLDQSAPQKKVVVASEAGEAFACRSPYVFDGDTFDCKGRRVRLSGIDAPEMPDHCRPGRKCVDGDPFAAKEYMQQLTRGDITCYALENDHYGRTVAECMKGDINLSCAMVAAGHAVKRYRPLDCP